MWPFRKKSSNPHPPDITSGGMTARYDAKLEHWVFECDGIEFNLSGLPFNPQAFDWAKEAASMIRSLNRELRARVGECLGDFGDETKAEILSVDLGKYGESKTMDIAFIGDESWGDFGVNVIVDHGKIADVYGGD